MKLDTMQRLDENYSEYTETDYKIYSYIRNNTRRIPDLTISELAELSQTSTSAITRFIRKNGYDRFVDFRIDIGKYISHGTMKEEMLAFEGDRLSAVSNSLLEFSSTAIELALQDDNEKRINDFVSLLQTVDLVFVHGTGLSALAAESFYQKALRTGLNVHMVADISTVKYIMQTHQGSACLLSISNSGLSQEVLSLVNYAKKENIKTVSLTRTGKNPISSACDLQIGNGSTMSSKEVINSSIYAQLIIVDLIIIVFSNRQGLISKHSEWFMTE